MAYSTKFGPRRSYSRSLRRRSYRRSYRGRVRNRVGIVPRNVPSRVTSTVYGAGPVPDRLITRFVYNESYLAPGGASWDYVYNLNSIYDPNRSAGGHQAMGHDQMALLYGRYRVIGVWIDYQCYSAINSHSFAVFPSNDATSFLSINAAAEQAYSVSGIATPGTPVRVRKYIDLAQITGLTRAQYMADDRYQAQFSADPAEIIVLHTVAADLLLGPPAAAEFGYSIKLTFIVECFDRIVLPLS